MTATFHNDPIAIPNRFDSSQHKSQHGPSSPKQADIATEVPPSPTLTNPDMILPYDGERESSTPSPPFRLPPLSDMQILHGGQPLPPDFRNGTNYGGDSFNSQIGVAVSMPNRPPRSKWAYNSNAPGRPLSDIGEEDTQSSPPRSRSTDWNYRATYEQQTHGEESDTCSSGSSSTISARGGQGRRVEHENVDEQRTSQESVEAVRARTAAALISGGSHHDDSSSTILSSEAERILENAKKRLTLMEGNLTRARSSTRLTPSPSPTSSGSLLPLRSLQPAGELYRSISQTDRRGSILRPRQVYNVTQDAGSNSHSRVYSETNLPSTLDSGLRVSDSMQQSRSLSALGSTSTSSYKADDGSFQYNPARANLANRPSSAFYYPTLDSLNEDGACTLSQRDTSTENPQLGLEIGTNTQAPKISTMEEFNSAYPLEGPPSRAQSQLQVRDLRDQAEGLKTKISMLKIKTQEDNLRRRSLQSLRTPSPFAAAEQWYTSAMEYRDGNGNLTSNAGYGWSPKLEQGEDKVETPRIREDKRTLHSTDAQADDPSVESIVNQEVAKGLDDSDDDINSVIESHYEDAEEGDYDFDGSSGSEIDRDALNEILNEPLDDDDDDEDNEVYDDFPPMAPPEATPHEEREDAFDYENFYLHSALGTYTRSRMRRLSYDSTGSVETTRPADSSRPGAPGQHSRSNSSDSISTAATFATATENAYESDDQQDAEHEINRALNWPQDPRNGVYSHATERDSATSSLSIGVHQHQKRRSTSRGRLSQTQNSTMNPSGILTPPESAARDAAGSVTPVSAFVSSLVSSVSAIPSPRPSSSLDDADIRLLEQVFRSLGIVCADLQELTAPDVDADPKLVRTLRRRLDAARRVLDGQLDP